MNKKFKRSLLLGLVLIAVITSGCSGLRYAVSTVSVSSSIDNNSQSVVSDNSKEFENDLFKVKVSFGLDGMVKANAYMPVNLLVHNKKDDFTGKVRLINPSDYQDGVAYEKEFTIAKDSEKNVILSMPSVGTNYFYVELVTSDNKTVLTQKVRMGMVDQMTNKTLAGVLSDDFSALNYFENAKVEADYFSSDVKLLELTQETLPEDVNSLTCLNYLIINDFNTTKLTDEQVDAIKTWVEYGGTLIMGTGAQHKKVLGAFSGDYIGGVIGDTKKKEVTLSRDAKKTGSVQIDHLDIQVNNEKPIKTVLSGIHISQIQKGKGSFNLVPFNLGSKEITEWKNQKSFAKDLLHECRTVQSDAVLVSGSGYGGNQNYNWSLISALDFFRDIKIPNAGIYTLVFSIYVLVIGPIGYFILKRRDKRERIWLLVPMAALIFYGVMIVLSSGSRIKRPIATSLTTLELGEDKIDKSIYITMQNPNGKPYEVEFNKDCQNFSPIDTEEYYGSYQQNRPDNYKFRYAVNNSNSGMKASFSKSRAFSKERISFYSDDVNDGRLIDINVEATTKELNGTITNDTGYDIEHAFFYYNNAYVDIGEFKAGAVFEITKENTQSLNGSYSYDFINKMMPMPLNPTNEELIAHSDLSNLYNYFMARYVEGKSYKIGYIFGIVKDFNGDYIKDEMIQETSKAMVLQEFTMTPSDVGEVYIPSINSTNIQTSSGDIDWQSNYLYNNEVEVTYQFNNQYDIEKLILSKGIFKGEIQAYNENTNQYEVIFGDSDELAGKELKTYFTENNTIKIKYSLSNGASSGEGPSISATGGIK